jgi:hypothetical protein
MSQPKLSDLTALDQATLFGLLARLRRKGARLEPDGAVYRIVYPGERRRAALAAQGEPSRQVEAACVAAACEQGWLTQPDEMATLRLTEAGALAAQRGAGLLSPRAAVAAPITVPVVARARARASLSPLQRLRHMRDGKGAALLTSAQVEAGERLAADFVKGQMVPRVTSNWDRAALGFGAEHRGRGGAADISDGAAAAQERVRRALAEAGSDFADLLIDVCCLEIGLEAVEKRRGWPPGAGRVVLSMGLERLLRSYGIVAAGPTRGRTGHWGGDGYRPLS